MSYIPVVDMADHANPETRAAFVQALGHGLAEYGFVAVQNHGVPLDLISDGYARARQLFGLDVGVKRQY